MIVPYSPSLPRFFSPIQRGGARRPGTPGLDLSGGSFTFGTTSFIQVKKGSKRFPSFGQAEAPVQSIGRNSWQSVVLIRSTRPSTSKIRISPIKHGSGGGNVFSLLEVMSFTNIELRARPASETSLLTT